jgi:hypothetical protein
MQCWLEYTPNAKATLCTKTGKKTVRNSMSFQQFLTNRANPFYRNNPGSKASNMKFINCISVLFYIRDSQHFALGLQAISRQILPLY